MSNNMRRIFDRLRRPDKNRKNPLALLFFGIIFGMIIVAFIFMDPGMMGGGSYGNSTAIRVGSSVVPISTYRQHMQTVEQSLSMFGNSGNDQMVKVLRRRMQQQAITEMINKEIITSLQNDEGLVIPDAQVSKVILGFEFLQEDGRFQRDRYYTFLSNINMSADRFEDSLRKDIRYQVVRDLFTESFKKPSIETAFADGLADLRFQIDYVALSTDDFKARVDVSDEQAQKFLEDSEGLKKAKDYYAKNASLFTEPETVKAKVILILAEDGSAKSFSDAKDRLDEVTKNLTPENFSEIAKEHSDDPTATSGGDLGYVERGTYIPEWDQVAFSTPVGKISKAFRTGAGWMRLLIEEKKPAQKREFELAKMEVAKALVAEEQATGAIDQIRNLLKDGNTSEIEQVLQSNDLDWVSTPTLALDVASIPGIGASERIISSVLSLKNDKEIYPSLIPFDGRIYLVRRGKITQEKSEVSPMQAAQMGGDIRRNDIALAQWLESKTKNVKIDMNPALQEEMENN